MYSKLFQNYILFSALFVVLQLTCLNAELKINLTNSEDAGNTSAEHNSNKNSTSAKNDIIKFKNGDMLHGAIVSLDTKGISWKSGEAENNILFKTENVRDIILGDSVSYSVNANAQVLLTNGDILAGKLLELNSANLILNTNYAGELKIDRFMIQSIYPGVGKSNGRYRGPNSIEEWIFASNTRNNSNAEIKDGILSITDYTSIGRDMKLPDLSKVEFDMAGDGNSQLQVQLYGNQVSLNPRDGYVLYISPGYIYLQRYRNGNADNLGNFQTRDLQSGKGKITLLSNKKDKKIILMVNGKIAKQWSDTIWGGAGGFVSFINQSNSTVKIKNITAGSWNGKVPVPKAETNELKNDSISFINDDIVSGKLISIKGEKVLFKTDYAEMDIPLKRVKEITTASSLRRRARRRGDDIRCYFPNGDSITLSVKEINGGILEGETENYGNSKIKLNLFSRLQLNIYDDDDNDE